MRSLLFSIPICLAISATVHAQTTGKAEDGRDVHPPTGRVGTEVPTMTTEEAETQEQKKSEDRKEEVHPPTGRVGKTVPPMTKDAPK